MKETKSNFADKVGRNTQHQKDSKKGFGYLDLPKGITQLKLKEGVKEVELDIIPYIVTDEKHPDRDPEYDVAMPDTQWYRRPIKVHTNVGTNKESCICPKSIGKKCPICDYQEKRRKEGADKEEIKKLYPKPRSLYNVIPIGMDKVEEKVHIWDMSDYLFQQILNEELETDAENRVFPDLKNGKTLTLKIRWKELNENSFPDVRSISFDDRDPYKDSVLDETCNLDEILKVLSYEALEAKFFEMEEEQDGGKLKEVKEDKEDRSSRRRNRDDDEDNDKKEERGSRRHRTDDDEEPEKKESKVERTRKTEPEEETRTITRSKSSSKEEPAKSSSKGKSSSDPECPSGYEFGVDADDKSECENCPIWGKCLDKKEGR
jgi:hypothetical protein